MERVKARLDPYDFLLWLAEEINDDAYEEWLQLWATPLGLALNIIFILARGSSAGASRGRRRGHDDVFGDGGGDASGWFSWLVSSRFIHMRVLFPRLTNVYVQCLAAVQLLTFLCFFNAFYVFCRVRSYRLFEQPVDVAPTTRSAHRVRVDSSPASSSPLRHFQSIIASATASARAYPDAEREVWEINVWDPKHFHLDIFTLFSPGHVVVYWLLLPSTNTDQRPAVTVATAIAVAALLSAQLWALQSSFIQQSKDTSLVHGEVMNEYDTKYVRPSLNHPVRDVGVQTRESAMTPRGTKTREVDVYTPTTIVKRGFRTNPNTNYAGQYDPDNLASQPSSSRRESGFGTASGFTPPPQPVAVGAIPNSYTNAFTQSPLSRTPLDATPLKSHRERLRERSPMKGDGGSLGVYSHAASPLRKAASSNQLLRGRESRGSALASPLKRTSTPGSVTSTLEDEWRRRQTGRF